jgi:hypothetical protein
MPDRHDDVARADRPATHQPSLGKLHPPAGSRRLRLPDRGEPALVLVHLRVVAVAPVVLDQLELTRDGVLGRLGLLPELLVACGGLHGVGAVRATERLQPAVADLPRARDDRVQKRPVV